MLLVLPNAVVGDVVIVGGVVDSKISSSGTVVPVSKFPLIHVKLLGSVNVFSNGQLWKA